MLQKRFISVFIFTVLFSSLFADRFGLVLSGGGAKGAYEVGVWKALEEYGITKDIDVISGTSVGALNGALFACTDVEKAEKLWRKEVGYSSFLMPDTTSLSEIAKFALNQAEQNLSESKQKNDPYGLKYYGITSVENDVLTLILDGLNFLADTGVGLAKGTAKYLSDYIFSEAHSDGLFTRDALEEIMSEYVSLEKIQKSGKEVYATAIAKDGFLLLNTLNWLLGTDSTHYFKLNEQISDENVHSVLMASSSFPLVYKSTNLSGSVVENGRQVGISKEYIDGGFESVGGKNTPVEPVMNNPNIDTMIVVYLKSQAELNSTINGSWISEKDRQRKKVIEIVPSKNLGAFFDGTVNFDPEKINELVDLGYEDTDKLLKDLGYKKRSKFQKFITTIF
ncbi:MAG: patatin-like phospholipase family protein [Treponema sp.]|nr:patatin-like phospholipase family protein [Treponema sp.]